MADQDKPTTEERPLWSLNRDDQRLLWITFAGGVASFVVGAAVLGLAFGIVRAFRSNGGSGEWLFYLVVVLFSAQWLILAYLAFFRSRRPGRVVTPRVRAVLLTLFSLLGAIFLLFFAGLAAGIT